MKTPTFYLLVIYLGATSAYTRKQEAAELNRRRVSSSGRRPSTTIAPTTGDDGLYEYIEVDLPPQCPQANGYFPDPDQCDKYYDCRDGTFVEKLCPDGLVFNHYQSHEEKCDLPVGIDCSERPGRQQAQPSPNCPRLHGYFPHEDPRICNIFYYCVDGKFNKVTCPDGLVFSEKTGICTWPDEAKKKGCGSAEIFNFTCPVVDDSVAATHPRYPDEEDCQFFYVCINGNVPRRSGCKLGQAFDYRTSKCDWARKIPECKDWYKGQLTDAELDALENPVLRVKSESNRRKGARPTTASSV